MMARDVASSFANGARYVYSVVGEMRYCTRPCGGARDRCLGAVLRRNF
jgi:hypothetical protein